jgi:hypothetical protein
VSTIARLKFRCEEIDRSGPLGPKITLTPLFISTEDGKTFFIGPPRGRVQLESVTAEAAALFEAGQEYFIDFVPAFANAAPANNDTPSETKSPAGETDPPANETPEGQGETKPPAGETTPQT